MRTRIALCGALEVELDGRRVESLLPGRQGRAVCAFLLLNRERETSRDELTEVVWPGGAPAAAGGALRALLCRVRAVLGDCLAGGPGGVRMTLPPEARIDLDQATGDIASARAAIGVRDWPAGLEAARRAAVTLAHPLVPDLYGDWIDRRRAENDELRLEALEQHAHCAIEHGGSELAAGVLAARALTRDAPYREAAYGHLIRGLARQGNRAEALLAYDDLRTRLRDELGVAPTPELQALHAELLGAERRPAATLAA